MGFLEASGVKHHSRETVSSVANCVLAQFEIIPLQRGHPEGLQSRRIWRASAATQGQKLMCFRPGPSQPEAVQDDAC